MISVWPHLSCYRLVQVEVPQQLQSDLKSQMEAAGIPVPDSQERWDLALQALKVLLLSSCHSRRHLAHAYYTGVLRIPEAEERRA
jgi:hypothetical protein